MEDFNPREENDNLGTMELDCGRYLAVNESGLHTNSVMGMITDLKKDPDNIVLPVYAYIHGAIRLLVGENGNPFYGKLPQGHAEFDSGLAGFIFVDKTKIKKNFKVKEVTQEVRTAAELVLRSEVEEFDQYLNG